jgi:phenylacetate-coenzyme A ligase PaaK-like adenylate-forming protein
MTNYWSLLETLYRLKTFQYKHLEEIRKYQLFRFKKILRHAYRHVPIYKQFYDSQGFDIYSVQNFKDIEQVPIINKEIIRSFPVKKRVDQRASESQVHKETTSGSTGEPFEIWTDQTESLIQALKGVRLLRTWGYSPFHQTIQVWRQDVKPKQSPIQRLGLFRRNLISIMDEPDIILEKLKKSHCDVLFSTRSSLEIVSSELITKNIEIRPRILVSCCELVTNEHRQLFRKAFDCETLEIYGCVEAGNIAWGCPTNPGNLHIDMETVIVNLHNIKYTPDGHKEGAIIVTNLENHIMPFIRYDLGDVISIPESTICSCGRTLPILGKIIGRNDDILEYNGRKYNFHFFYNYFKNFLYISKYKIVQTKNGDIEFIIQLSEDTEENRQLCLSELSSIFGSNFSPLNLKFVDSFPVPACGKFKVLEKQN